MELVEGFLRQNDFFAVVAVLFTQSFDSRKRVKTRHKVNTIIIIIFKGNIDVPLRIRKALHRVKKHVESFFERIPHVADTPASVLQKDVRAEKCRAFLLWIKSCFEELTGKHIQGKSERKF